MKNIYIKTDKPVFMKWFMANRIEIITLSFDLPSDFALLTFYDFTTILITCFVTNWQLTAMFVTQGATLLNLYPFFYLLSYY